MFRADTYATYITERVCAAVGSGVYSHAHVTSIEPFTLADEGVYRGFRGVGCRQ